MKTYKTERQKLVEQYQNLQTNDELLAAQAQYFKQKKERESKFRPSKKEENKQNESGSKLKQNRDTDATTEQGNKSNNKGPKVEFKQSSLVVSDILEKNTANIGSHEDHNAPFIVTEKGFPAVIKHNAEEIANDVKLHQQDSMWHHQQFFNTKPQQDTDTLPKKKQKLSLFAQRMQSKNVKSNTTSDTLNDQQINNNNDYNKTDEESHPMSNVIRSLKMPQTATDDKTPLHSADNVSFIKKLNMECNIVTDDEINKIGSENDTFLRQQDASEILKMRQELLSTLDPQLVALLTGKKAKPQQKDVKQKKPKLKISYQDSESKEETKSKSKPKSTVIRKLKPLKSRKKTTAAGNMNKMKQTSSASEWIHPAKEIRRSFDASVDLNNNIPGPTQKEKMQWMEPLNVEQEEEKYAKADAEPLMLGDNPLAYYRFGFDGEVLCDNKGIIHRKSKEDGADLMHLGLHHHGEEPLKPGYTVNELIHLCKSSAPNQRNTAIKTLMHCIQKMRCGEYGMEYSEYLWILLQQNNLIPLIVDILSMEKNVSCIMPILDILHAVIAPMSTLFAKMDSVHNESEDIYATCSPDVFYNAQTERLSLDGIHILCNTLPNVAPEAMNTNQTLFAHDDKKGQYEKGSLKKKKEQKKNQMNDIWKCDVILALIRKTKLILYLNRILSKYIIPNIDGNDTMYVKNILPTLLDIIMTLVRHHPQIVDIILKTNQFIHNLLEIVFCRNSDKDKAYALYKCKVLDIICIMCQMDKKVIEYLHSNNKLNEFKTFIVEGIDNPNHSEKLQLSISTLHLWRICIKFGYDFNAFNDLLPKLMHLLTRFIMKYDLKTTTKNTHSALFVLQQKQTRGFLNIIHILLQSLIPSNLAHLPSIATVSWNQIAKLTEKIIAIFDDIFQNQDMLDSNRMTQTDWLCIGGLCHIIAAYFNTLKKQNDGTLGQPFNDIMSVAKKQSMILTKKYIATWCRTKENKLLSGLLLNKRNWTYNNTKTGDKNDKRWLQFPFLDGLLADIPLSIAVLPTDEYLSKCDCLLSIIRMVRSFVSINKNIISILIDSQFIDGIGRILLQITSKHFHFRLNRSLRGLLFNYWRIEFLLAYEILMLCSICSPDLSDMKALNVTNIHSAACVLLECLPPGYMHCADVLLSKFILRDKYLVSMTKLAVKHLKKTDSNKQLIALYQEGPDLNPLKDIYRKEDKYLPNVFNPNIIGLCDRAHSSSNTARIQSLCAVPSMVPTFWMLQPLVNLYKHNIASHSITTLLHFFVIISRCYSDDFMDEIVTMNEEDEDEEDEDIRYKSHHYWCNIAVWDAYRSVTTLYLCDSDIYCDALNRCLIYQVVNQCWNRIYFAEHRTDSCDIYLCDKNDPSSACMIDQELNEISDINIKSLSREWEGFYTRLVEQFESDSFGDDLFAKIVLFQQQNKYKKQFRTVVWSSMDSLCVLLKHEYPPNIYVWKSFFIPFETDDVIIDLQFQAIQKNKFNNLSNYRKQSFFYFVAVVQISHHIWDCKRNKNGYGEMLSNVLKQCERSVIVDIVNCDFKRVESLQMSHLYDTSKAVHELKEYISVGKEHIMTQEKYLQDRISILRKDFLSVCKTLSLL